MHRHSSLSPRSLAFDVLLALGIAALDLSIAVPITEELSPGLRVLALVLVTFNAGTMGARRAWPLGAFAVSIATGLVVLGGGLPTVVLTLGPLVMVYSIAAQFPGKRSLVALAITLCGFIATDAAKGFPNDLSTVVANLVILAAAWLIGWFVYRRQEYVRQLEWKTAELEEAREELARAAVSEERLRIARELHDIVAHSLSMITVQAGVGAHVIDSRPEEARTALANVERVSRQALLEMRALLGMLRDRSADADLAPLPGLAQVPALIEQVTNAGPAVELQVNGEAPRLPAGIDLTAYRVIQESLTNVVRHAEAERARVTLTYRPDSLLIEVVDDGRGPTGSVLNGGLGIEGMRERVTAFGGSFQTGPLKENGFHVSAELPIREDSA